MSTRAKVLTGFACVIGAVVVAWPFVSSHSKPRDQAISERVAHAYVKTLGRSAHGLSCSKVSKIGGVPSPLDWACVYGSGGFLGTHPHVVCVRVQAHRGRRIKCPIPLPT